MAGAAAAATCVATPNPTAGRVYVLFLPTGTVINDFGRLSCSSYSAYHFQIPSRGLFDPSPPFILPGTQGRPINIAIIPTGCFTSIREMMVAVTHELVEAATDPLPLAHWLDESTEPRTGVRLDPSNIETLLRTGEAADICGTKKTFTASNGSLIDVADYWSNHDHMCVSLDFTPPTVQITSRPSNPTNRTTASFTFTATDPDDNLATLTVSCSLDGAAPIGCGSLSASYAGLAEGTHVFTATAADPAGNVGQAGATWLVDVTPPATTFAAQPGPLRGRPLATGTATVTILPGGISLTATCLDSFGLNAYLVATDNLSGVAAIDYGTAPILPFQPPSSPPLTNDSLGSALTLPFLTPGAWVLSYAAVDNAGNHEATQSRCLFVDTVFGLSCATSPIPASNVPASGTVLVTGSIQVGAIVLPIGFMFSY